MSADRVNDAVNFLIDAPTYASLINEMTRIIETWDTHPMSYGGHLACLNAMLDVGLQNRAAFERLVQLIEDKRKEMPAGKRDYQRDLMRSRRARMAMALELHERKYGPLRGAARMSETQAIQGRWMAAKRQFLANKGVMDWKQRNEATQEFWQQVDHNLELNLRNAQKLSLVG